MWLFSVFNAKNNFVKCLVKGEWNWVDHSPYDYSNWYEGEPNHDDDFLYCSRIYVEHEDRFGTWDDKQCNNFNGFICKKERSKNQKF